MPRRWTLLGVDVGSRLKNAGVAAGWCDAERIVVDEVCAGCTPALPGKTTEPAIDPVARWLADRIPIDGPTLLALDAPLGWPTSLSRGLAEHAAGQRIVAVDGPDRLWRRITDQDVHARFGKLPLEVGANYIARTAWTALEMLHQARQLSGRKLPVPLTATELQDGAVETYPAATLRAWLGEDPGSYKAKDPAPREALLDRLCATEPITITPAAREAALAVDHAFDALVCVLAGADFVRGHVPKIPTSQQDAARREGWIHVRGAVTDDR